MEKGGCMGIGYTLLLISIVLLCIWFFYVSEKSQTYYRKLFVGMLWMVLIMYINRLLCVCLELGDIPNKLYLKNIERVIHYILVKGIYSFYAYFIYSLLYPMQRFTRKQRSMFFAATYLTDILIISSPITKLIFYVENDVVYKGPLFWGMIAIRILYALIGTAIVLKKRNLLPRVFGQSILLITFFTVIQFVTFITTDSENMFYTTLATNVIILMFAYIVMEFYKDKLTGLFNRTAFEQYAVNEIHKSNNKEVYLIKVKKYEYLKETCKEEPVSLVIKELADFLKKCSRVAAIYYLDNGKFALIVTKDDHFDGKIFIDAVEERLKEPFKVNGASIHLTLFVAIMNLEGEKIRRTNFMKYFTACDAMRYRSGEVLEVINGNSFGIDRLQRYYDVEEAIDRALEENEFTMYYQPIISSVSKKVVSAEALIRLNDRVLGFISPEEFIPISENNGKIMEISDYVIDNVFRFVKEHDITTLGLEYVEMNLSMIQCLDKNLPQKLQYYLEKYDLNPRLINLEITETAASFDENMLKDRLLEIKKLGFTFSLDDYGTGYSNLVRVLEYPVDIIKLDKTIIWSAFHDLDNYVTLKNLIGMFHDVRRKMVAEGVESEEQMRTLCSLECDYLQGYFYSKPINESEFIDFVERYNN